MSKIENIVETVECYYCGQLSFIDDMTKVSIQDGPDDCIDVGMCGVCAEEYNQDVPEHDWKEEDERYG